MADQAWQTTLEKIREDYTHARKLIDFDSLSDPPTEPYKSKYKAREILKELLELIGCHETNGGGDSIPRRELIRALLKYDLGTIATDTEELSLGQEYFEDGLKIIGEHRYEDPRCCMLVVHLLNQLGILYSGREDKSKARDLFKLAEKIYTRMKSQEGVVIYDFTDYFLPEGEQPCSSTTDKNFEKAFTHTLCYLAQVYEALGEAELSAMYCHSTLKKQLSMDELDHVDWALNAATLSQFFIVRGDFAAGRHHLACASYILSRYEETLSPEALEDTREVLKHRRADVARCWAKYCLLLLRASKEVPDEAKEEVRNAPHVLVESDGVAAHEKSVTDRPVSDYEAARPVFLAARRRLDEAAEYYTLQDHASDHVQIVRETSRLYAALIAFESAPDRRCKMHKRRIDLLEEVLREISPKHYLGERRQILLELGETYGEMADAKLSQLPAVVLPQSAQAKKINALIGKAIANFDSLLETLRDSEKKLPSKFPEDMARPALVAHFCVGRLHSKLIVSDPRDQMENYKRTKDYYDYVVDYCERHPDHAKEIQTELEVVKELAELIPGMIQSSLGSVVY